METVKSIIDRRGIQEILHFTKGSSGLTGILHMKAVQSRYRLERDDRLAYIFEANASSRRDTAWLDYVNLSVSEINSAFFSASCHWHKEAGEWWVILSFDPVIAEHSGVFFTTTNNFYTGVKQAQGPDGLQASFADRILKWHDWRQGVDVVALRKAGTPDCLTTCEQAEILYPKEVSTEFLRRIYVRNGEDMDDTMAQLDVLGHGRVEVVVAPERFNGDHDDSRSPLGLPPFGPLGGLWGTPWAL
jgi:hypothetical protein